MAMSMNLIRRILLHIWYYLRARYRYGHGIHPPFAFEFTSRVIFGRDTVDYEDIEKLRMSLLASRDPVQLVDPGAGSGGRKRFEDKGRFTKITGRLVKKTSVGARKGKLLARIAEHLAFPVIIELGTGAGFSSIYMARAARSSLVLSCEGSSGIAELARKNIQRTGTGNIRVWNRKFRDWLPGILEEHRGELLVFIDGDHRGSRMLEYCRMIMDGAGSKRVIILDDIHWSVDMYRAWMELVRNKGVSLSFELRNTGIIFMGYPVQKEHYIIRYYV